MTLPDIHGLTWRPATPVDGAAVSAVFNAGAAADGIPERIGAEAMTHELKGPEYDLPNHSMVAVADGTVVGYCLVFMRTGDAPERRSFVDVEVLPEWRDHVEDALVEWGIDAAAHRVRAVPGDAPRFVCHWNQERRTERLDRFRSRGFEEVRYAFEMERELADLPERSEIDGVVIRPWESTDDAPSHPVYAEAFGDHWGSTIMSSEHWTTSILQHPNVRTDLSHVAEGDGGLVGYCLVSVYPEDEEASGRTEGWIDSLGVLRASRKRGVASALLVDAMRAMADVGLEWALLGVDAENPSGALGLYERLGFTERSRSITLQREVGRTT